MTIYEAPKAIQELRTEFDRLREQVRQNERRADKQKVVLRALFVILEETHGIAEATLRAHIDQIEKQTPENCAKCGRPILMGIVRCPYCEAPRERISLFDSL